MRDPRKAFESKLVELGKANERIYAISCDSASGGGLGAFFKEYPARSVEVGISEQTGVGVAAGLSRQGLIPVLVAINPFLTMRAYEQVRDDLGYMNCNVKIVGSGGGLAYSTLGSTHIALEDVALMSTIPHMTVLAPGDADEVEFALEEALRIEGPVYIRMPRQARQEPLPRERRTMEIGKGEVLSEGNVALFTYGPSVEQAMKAQAILKEEGIELSVVNFTTVKPLDTKSVLKFATDSPVVFTLEEHSLFGGLGTAVADVLAAQGAGVPLVKLGVPEGSKQTGPYDELVDYYGLSGQAVARKIKETLAAKGCLK
jgi:transketolase